MKTREQIHEALEENGNAIAALQTVRIRLLFDLAEIERKFPDGVIVAQFKGKACTYYKILGMQQARAGTMYYRVQRCTRRGQVAHATPPSKLPMSLLDSIGKLAD